MTSRVRLSVCLSMNEWMDGWVNERVIQLIRDAQS